MDQKTSPIDDMIAVSGSARALGRLMNVSPQTILNWRDRGVPEWRVLEMEAATGCPRNRIRPDLYATPDALSPWDTLRAQGMRPGDAPSIRRSKQRA